MNYDDIIKKKQSTDVYWIHVYLARDEWQVQINMAINLHIPWKVWNSSITKQLLIYGERWFMGLITHLITKW